MSDESNKLGIGPLFGVPFNIVHYRTGAEPMRFVMSAKDLEDAMRQAIECVPHDGESVIEVYPVPSIEVCIDEDNL